VHLVGLSWCPIYMDDIDQPAVAAADCPAFEDDREKS
jgi:hypothetical protein